MLSAEHLSMLREESSISGERIQERGYRTVTDVKDLKALGFASSQLRVPGLLLPLHATDGQQPFCEYRPDIPREIKGKLVKYEQIKGGGVRVDCPPVCQPMLADPSIPLWITEGKKKADALASRGACVIDLSGVSGFKGKNPFGGVTFLADFDYIALNNGRDIRLIFDSDLFKVEVRTMLDRFTEHLQRKGAHVSVVYLPHENGKKCGVDDYLAAGHTLADLEALVEGPRPQPQPARAIIKLLDDAPLSIRRPLALINRRAYAAIWPHVEMTDTETVDKQGNIVKLNPPIVKTEQHLLIVRDDGRIFGDAGDESLKNLGLTACLDSVPPDDLMWHVPSVKAYHSGTRPDLAEVFRRVSAVYDHYLDFNRSLAAQQAMCDLSACLSLMTWLSQAFTVLPYPWANGDWGAGKTKWGTLWAKTSYLGYVLTLGGSFAALRDLADYGATLLFDDAEALDDKKTDPDKRALLLAGNRRGAKVPLKELSGDKTWKVRWVNAYCSRGFTAKKKPYGALETRALLIPLIKTADQERGNRDPEDTERWPCAFSTLRDDLWSTALMLLAEAKSVWDEFDKETALVGRLLEVWRAPLAVARLFERHGVSGLESEIRKVMHAGLSEKIEAPRNQETKTVEAIGAIAFGASDMSDMSGHDEHVEGEVRFTADDVVQRIKDLADPDEDTEWAIAQKIGLIFNTLRIPKDKDSSSKKRTRWRKLLKSDVLDMLRAYGLLPINMSGMSEHVHMSETAETPETLENGSGPNGRDEAEAERMAREEREAMREEADDGPQPERARCRCCGKRNCQLTPWGQVCKLSIEDQKRWATREAGLEDEEVI